MSDIVWWVGCKGSNCFLCLFLDISGRWLPRCRAVILTLVKSVHMLLTLLWLRKMSMWRAWMPWRKASYSTWTRKWTSGPLRRRTAKQGMFCGLWHGRGQRREIGGKLGMNNCLIFISHMSQGNILTCSLDLGSPNKNACLCGHFQTFSNPRTLGGGWCWRCCCWCWDLVAHFYPRSIGFFSAGAWYWGSWITTTSTMTSSWKRWKTIWRRAKKRMMRKRRKKLLSRRSQPDHAANDIVHKTNHVWDKSCIDCIVMYSNVLSSCSWCDCISKGAGQSSMLVKKKHPPDFGMGTQLTMLTHPPQATNHIIIEDIEDTGFTCPDSLTWTPEVEAKMAVVAQIVPKSSQKSSKIVPKSSPNRPSPKMTSTTCRASGHRRSQSPKSRPNTRHPVSPCTQGLRRDLESNWVNPWR